MAKDISTLVDDIYAVVEGNGGWDETINEHFIKKLGVTLSDRLNPKGAYKPTLRVSNLGSPCEAKLWYSINEPNEGSTLASSTRLLFLYGDILEDLLISLCEAAGHEVTGLQDTLKVAGLTGHRDCVIDGVTVDIKSASNYNFDKFKFGTLRGDDTYGYISQLSSYVYAGAEDPLVRDKSNGAFLVINKTSGEVVLDTYDLTEEIKNKEEEVNQKRAMVKAPKPPKKAFSPTPDGYYVGKKADGVFKANGNMKLNMKCNFCDFKKKCFPNIKGYDKGRYGTLYLTEVSSPPKNKYRKVHTEVEIL